MSHISLLQDALTRASLKGDSGDPQSPIRRSQRGRSRKAASPPAGEDSTEESEDEDALVGVQTPMTVPGTPRSTSPTRSGSRMAQRRKERELEAATSIDPLRRLPNELSSRIFADLSPRDLLACGRTCKKWRKSQTINYCWYVKQQADTFLDSPTAKPTWTRKESKQDWAARYKSTHRRDDLEHRSAADAELERARSDGYRTPKEEREDRWKADQVEETNVDKAAARAYYKGLKNAKGAKGGRVGVRDRAGFGADEE